MKDVRRIYYQGTGKFSSGDIFALARSYRIAYDTLIAIYLALSDDTDINVISREQMYLILVSFANLSFSCELMAKALALRTNRRVVRGHKLDDLVNEIELTRRTAIEARVGDPEFGDKLTKNSSVFEKLRYFYDGNVDFDIDFLKKLNDSLTEEFSK